MSLIVNHKNKWAYIHIPKTGGTSLTSILLNVDGSEQVTTHGSLNQLNNVDDYFIFTMVRNPYTRIASWYEHTKRDIVLQTFKDFLLKIDPLDFLYFPQEWYAYHGKTDKTRISYVGKYENFEQDSMRIFKKIGIKVDSIPHLNRNVYWEKYPNLNTHNLYKQYYTEEWMRDWIKTKYKNDFKLFEYDMELR